jgi:SAM-dependent methyltransferase
MPKPLATRELDPNTLRDAIIARLPHRSHSEAKLRLPAIPARLDHYTQLLTTLFAGLGNTFSADETARLRKVLERELSSSFDASPLSRILISLHSETPPETGIHYEIKREAIALSEARLRLPAIPALLNHYTQLLTTLFAGLGSTFSANNSARLRKALERELRSGFDASPFSKILISFHSETPPETGIHYEIKHEVITLEDEYEEWVRSRKPPLFGAHPDAKVMSLAHALGPPGEVCVLDVGAGTGRNTLPLAREGFRIDAVELAPSLAKVLRTEVASKRLDARVLEGDALDPALPVPVQTYRLVVLAEVVASHFRSVAQLRQLFERAADWLVPGGLLAFSGFVASDDYEPDLLAKQASQVFWSCLFTRRELELASRDLPFERISDESCYAFEHKNLAAHAWPPTGWFARWSRGYDLFELPSGKPPHELRWLVYRRTDGRPRARGKAYDAPAAKQISAQRERVFDAINDPQRAAHWLQPFVPVPGIASCEPFGSSQPGTCRRVTWTDGSVTYDELIESEAPLRLRYSWRSTLKGPLKWLFRRAESDWMLTPTSSGTSVYWTYRFEPRWRILAPLVRIAQAGFQRWMRASLERLQAVLEADGQASSREAAGRAPSRGSRKRLRR